jgi:hypothetical protein
MLLVARDPLEDLKATAEIVRWFIQGAEILRP